MIATRFLWQLYLLIAALLLSIFLLYSYPSPLHQNFYTTICRRPAKQGQFQWSIQKERYPVSSYLTLPTGIPKKLPTIQHEFPEETKEARIERLERREAVKFAFVRSWDGYRTYAWGEDELLPLSGGAKRRFGGWGATLVETLDTLWIMGYKAEFEEAVNEVATIDFTTTEDEEINVFETTVRYLGGPLGADDDSGGNYPVLLEKAVEVGDFLYAAFDTENRMPVVRWKWKRAREQEEQQAGSAVLLAELGALGLEFTRLSQLSGDPKFYDAIQRIYDVFESQQQETKLPGMWPVVVNALDRDFTVDSGFSLGAMSDSMYEYLPKQFILLGGLSSQPQRLYEEAIKTAKKHLFFRPMNEEGQDILIPGFARAENGNIVLEPLGQHLGCFVGGMMGLSSRIFNNTEDLEIARKLVDGCTWVYDNMRIGIMPETFHVVPCPHKERCPWDEWDWYEEIFTKLKNVGPKNLKAKIRQYRLQPGFVDFPDQRYILRSEAIESLFILYRITGDTDLIDVAWEMFASIERATRTENGNAALEDVTIIPPLQADSMDPAWTAETLKYMYLILSSPDLVSLDEWVFNTQAHPFKRPK